MYNIRIIGGLFALVLLCGIVVAQLGVPHQFYGDVNFADVPAPDGSLVEAKIDGTTVATITTSDGKYGYDQLFYVEDPNTDRDGEVIHFFVRGYDTGETDIFQNGMSTRLDLPVNTSLKCGDGTDYGKCSSNKPRYCDDGDLVNNCQKCGCPSGKECRGDGNCYVTSSGGGRSSGGGGGGGGYGAKPKPSCFDGIENCHDGDCEGGIDCGGPCQSCPSCNDGVQNQGEEGIDCGGPCDACVTTTIETTTTIAPTTTVAPTTTAAPVTTTTVKATTTTTIVSPSVIGRVIAAAGGPVPIVVLLFLLLLSFAYFRGKKKKKEEKK